MEAKQLPFHWTFSRSSLPSTSAMGQLAVENLAISPSTAL